VLPFDDCMDGAVVSSVMERASRIGRRGAQRKGLWSSGMPRNTPWSSRNLIKAASFGFLQLTRLADGDASDRTSVTVLETITFED
jgi:hypothetical protein